MSPPTRIPAVADTSRRDARRGGVVRGDSIIVLEQSPNGANPRQRKNLEALGLGRRGSRSVRTVAHRSVQGQIRVVDHLVGVYPLTADPRLSFLRHGEGPLTMAMTEYSVEDRPAYELRLPKSERFQVELYDDYYSLVWSTALPPAELVDRLKTLMPFTADTAALAWTHARRTTDPIPATILEAHVAALGNHLDFLRIESADRTITWERPQLGRKAGAAPYRPGRFGFLAEVWDPSYLKRLMQVVGTPAVGKHADELLSHAAYVGESIRSGSLRA